MTNMKPWVMSDVRQAAREAMNAASKWGGWWTVFRNRDGTQFCRGARVASPDGFKPLCHVKAGMENIDGQWQYKVRIERA